MASHYSKLVNEEEETELVRSSSHDQFAPSPSHSPQPRFGWPVPSLPTQLQDWLNNFGRSKLDLGSPRILGAAALLFSLLFVVPYITRDPPPPPFDPTNCEICGPADDLCRKWGSGAISRSRAYEGSGYQLESLFTKIKAGKDINIGIVGGSISFCADNQENPEDCYVGRIGPDLEREWGVKVNVMQGSVAAMNSDYFAACWASPFTKEPDLVIIELAVNDWMIQKENLANDMLLRSILERDSRPGVLVLTMWSPLNSWTNGAPSIEALAQYYDLPVVSHRNAIYHHRRLHNSPKEIAKFFSTGTEGAYWPEGHHPSKLGHELTADLLVHFLRYRQCQPVPKVKSRMGLEVPEAVSPYNPWQNMMEQPNPRHHVPPKCYGAQPGLLHFPISAHPSPAAVANPFLPGHWKSKYYLEGLKAGDRVEFDIEVTNGFAGIMYWRSPSHGKTSLGLGRAWAWLDGEEDKRVLMSGDWGDPVGGNINNTPERENVKTEKNGPRKLIVEIMEDSAKPDHHKFRISTIIV